MAYGSGFGNNLPPWKPMAMQTPPLPATSTAAPGPISNYSASQLRMLNHSEPAPMPAGGAARPPVSRQAPINNSVGQMTPRSAGLGGSVSPQPSSLERFDNFMRPKAAFRTQGTVGASSFGEVFPPGPQPIEYAESIGPRAPYAESIGPRAPYAEPIGPHQAYKIGAGPYSMDDPFLYEKPVGPAYQSRAMRDLKGIGGALGKAGNFASYLFNNPVTNNQLTRTGMRVAAPVGVAVSGASALLDKSGYQDPVEKYFGLGNLHERVDAGNQRMSDALERAGGSHFSREYLGRLVKEGAPTAAHALYSATARPLVEGAEWAYNKFNPVSPAAAQPTAPAGSPPPASPPPAAPPAVQPPAGQPPAPGRQPSLSEQYPGRFKGVPSFRDVVAAAADSRKIPLTAQEQNYNAEVLRGMQLENRARELENVDRYRATQLQDNRALATLQATRMGGLGQQLAREQLDPEGKNDLMQQKLSQLDERTGAVMSALFDPNNPDSVGKLNNSRNELDKLNNARLLSGLPALTLEELLQTKFGLKQDPKTGYFAKPK